jgi:hypothetical protein
LKNAAHITENGVNTRVETRSRRICRIVKAIDEVKNQAITITMTKCQHKSPSRQCTNYRSAFGTVGQSQKAFKIWQKTVWDITTRKTGGVPLVRLTLLKSFGNVNQGRLSPIFLLLTLEKIGNRIRPLIAVWISMTKTP